LESNLLAPIPLCRESVQKLKLYALCGLVTDDHRSLRKASLSCGEWNKPGAGSVGVIVKDQKDDLCLIFEQFSDLIFFLSSFNLILLKKIAQKGAFWLFNIQISLQQSDSKWSS